MEFRCLRLLQVLCENRWHGKSQVTLSCIQYHKVKPTSVWTSIPHDQIAQSHILEFFRSGVGTSVVWSVLRKMDTQPTPPSSTIHPLHTFFRLGVCTPVAWSVYGKRATQSTLPSSSHTSPECSHSLETFRLDVHTLAMRSALRKIVPRNIFKQALEVGMGSNGQGFGCFRCV